MSCTRSVLSTRSRWQPGRGLLALSAVWLAATGCVSTQSRARQQAAERWNRARAQVKVRLASDQLAAGHVEDAATELAEACRLDPANPQLRALQARVHLARGDHHAAQRVLESVPTEDPQRAEIEYLLGIIQQQRLHWQEACERFARAAEEDPHEVAYLVAIVQSMLQLGQAEQALTLLRSHEEQFGWTGAYHAALAECCEQLDDWSAAATAWQNVADASDDPSVRERLAVSLYRCQRWSEAITRFQRLLEESEEQPDGALRLALAQCLLEARQPAAAQQQLSLALRDNPQNVPTLQLLALALAQQGQFQRAARTAERALRLEPDSPHALELAAAMAFRAGEKARALDLARRVMQGEPDSDNPVARHIIARLSTTPAEPGE